MTATPDDRSIPENWCRVTLGEILPLTYGSGLIEKQRDASGEVSVYGSNGVVGRHSEALTDGPCLIVGRKGAAGAVHYSAEPCWPIDTTYFAEGTPATDLRFFYYVLSAAELVQLDRSTAVPSLSRDDYNSVEVPLAPLCEQRRIVEKIEELFSMLDAGVAALRRVRANLKRYRASVLKAAVEGRLTEDWRAKHPDTEPASVLLDRILQDRRRQWEEDQLAKFAEKGQKPPAGWQAKYKPPTTPDTSDLPELPEGWVWANLGQLSGLITSGSRGWAEFYSDSGPAFVRAQDINTDRLTLETVVPVSPPNTSERTRSLTVPGDLLVTITGANVTKAATVPDAIGEAYVSQHVGLVRPVLRGLTPYLHTWVACPAHGRKDLLKEAYGAGKPGLNLDNLRDLKVALPPLVEQAEIIAEVERRLSVVDEIDAEVDAGLKRAARLRQAVLKRAFEGRLVPQDPNDEPASVLLERIRAERAKAQTKPTRGTRQRSEQATLDRMEA